jgi:hypothetical protein
VVKEGDKAMKKSPSRFLIVLLLLALLTGCDEQAASAQSASTQPSTTAPASEPVLGYRIDDFLSDMAGAGNLPNGEKWSNFDRARLSNRLASMRPTILFEVEAAEEPKIEARSGRYIISFSFKNPELMGSTPIKWMDLGHGHLSWYCDERQAERLGLVKVGAKVKLLVKLERFEVSDLGTMNNKSGYTLEGHPAHDGGGFQAKDGSIFVAGVATNDQR